ncbi:unnamed protein product [Toxocara canis]|uniref:Ubiquitin-like protease family profile domain-containing protein n=1 Tax=Toxocara canis TaxID=6265 RepID=A0A3P7IRE9_TOXCA|nr:unnamed protein product [Toxocara canis]
MQRRGVDFEGDGERKLARGGNCNSRPTSPPLITVPVRTRDRAAHVMQKPSYTVVATPLVQNPIRFGQIDARQISIVETRMSRQPHTPISMTVASTSTTSAIPIVGASTTNGAIAQTSAATPSESANLNPGDECKRVTRSAAQRKVVHTIDEDDAKKEPASEGCLIVYPNGEPGAVPVHFADVECLKPEQMLNDTVIDFFLKYIHRELVPVERRPSIFIFSSFFYGKLTNSNGNIPPLNATARAKWLASKYKSVRTWTKNVDLFSKDYIVVPINEDIHWYLAIIAHPSAAIVNMASVSQGRERVTHIIILDSLMDDLDPKRKFTADILREYLKCEYNDKRKQKATPEESFLKERVKKVRRKLCYSLLM